MDVDVARVESCNLLRWNACRINVCKIPVFSRQWLTILSAFLAVSCLAVSASPPRRRHCRPSGAVSKQSFSRDVSAWTMLEIFDVCFTPIASYSTVKCSCSPMTL